MLEHVEVPLLLRSGRKAGLSEANSGFGVPVPNLKGWIEVKASGRYDSRNRKGSAGDAKQEDVR